MSLMQVKEMEGVLLVDKPQGLTSHDVVYRLRRKLHGNQVPVIPDTNQAALDAEHAQRLLSLATIGR